MNGGKEKQRITISVFRESRMVRNLKDKECEYVDKHYKGYTKVIKNGKVTFIDERTGKDVGSVNIDVPPDSTIYTPQAKELRAEYAERSKKAKNSKKVNRKFSNFYFFKSMDRRGKMDKQTLARLMFLATYLLNGSDELYKNEFEFMTKEDAMEIMNLKKSTFYSFYGEVKGKYLFETDDGHLRLCKDFICGKIRGNKSSYDRVYVNTLRRIYNATPCSKHKYLGQIFAIMPYISFETNLICKNPHQQDADYLEPISIYELCDLVGYKRKNYGKLIEAYKNLTFEHDGKMYYFLAINSLNGYIMLNPLVVYGGSDTGEILALAKFCEVNNEVNLTADACGD